MMKLKSKNATHLTKNRFLQKQKKKKNYFFNRGKNMIFSVFWKGELKAKSLDKSGDKFALMVKENQNNIFGVKYKKKANLKAESSVSVLFGSS